MMARFRWLLIFVLGLFCAATVHAQGQVYVVTHIDTFPPAVLPPTAASLKPEGLLRQLAAETLKEAGCIRFEVLQQEGRANHFTLMGVWKNEKAFDDHEAAAYTRKFRESIQPILGSPFDERLHHLLQ